jgi:acyl-CoA reductase-like NAD-dependent aldehyde dehydrogenase
LIEALDTGNPVSAMLHDVAISDDYMELFAGLVTEIKGSTIPVGTRSLHSTLREPLGVVARIGAFNHPLLFVAGKCGDLSIEIATSPDAVDFARENVDGALYSGFAIS